MTSLPLHPVKPFQAFPLPPHGTVSLIYNGVGYYHFTPAALLAKGVPREVILNVAPNSLPALVAQATPTSGA